MPDRVSWESVGTAGVAGNPGSRMATGGHGAVNVPSGEPECGVSRRVWWHSGQAWKSLGGHTGAT